MIRLSASLAVIGLVVTVSACTYYPNGPYGPGYGPYPPRNPPPPASQEEGPPPGAYGPSPGAGESGPPPQSNYGQPPQSNYGPPPGQGAEGPPPGYGGEEQAAPNDKAARQIQKMNNPVWCNNHPAKCAQFRAKYGAQGQYGGPPPGGPDEQGEEGPPPNESGQPPQ